MLKYLKTVQMAYLEKTNGGLLLLLPNLAMKAFILVPLVFLWRVIMSSGVPVGLTLEQMLSYTFVSALLAEMLVVQTPASGWLSEGVLGRLFSRPASILGQLAAQTVGGWLPVLLFFSLPMSLLAPVLGIRILPASAWFFLSLLLCISLGFAVDILFACLSIKLRSMNWLVSRIRVAITALLSGILIPIRLLPFGLAEAMKYQPFASLGGAPLSLFVGAGNLSETMGLQLVWNLVLWPLALLVFRKSREGMVSYGG